MVTGSATAEQGRSIEFYTQHSIFAETEYFLIIGNE